MTDLDDLIARLRAVGPTSPASPAEVLAACREAAAALEALRDEVAQWRVRVERIKAELEARGADSVGDEASAYKDAALALRVSLDSAALAPKE